MDREKLIKILEGEGFTVARPEPAKSPSKAMADLIAAAWNYIAIDEHIQRGQLPNGPGDLERQVYAGSLNQLWDALHAAERAQEQMDAAEHCGVEPVAEKTRRCQPQAMSINGVEVPGVTSVQVDGGYDNIPGTIRNRLAVAECRLAQLEEAAGMGVQLVPHPGTLSVEDRLTDIEYRLGRLEDAGTAKSRANAEKIIYHEGH